MNTTENQRFIVRLIIFLILAAGFILILPRLQSLIIIVVISILIFTLLDPLVDKLERFNIPRGLSALLVMLLILTFIGLGISRFVPLVESAAQQISQSFSSENTFDERIESGIEYLNSKLPVNALTLDIPEKINEAMENIKKKLPQILMGFGKGIGKGVINTFSSFFFIIFITFFFLKDERAIKKGIIRLVPNKHFEMSLNIMDKIQRQLSSYLQGLFLAATSVGVTSIIGLFIINTFFDAGVNYIVLIGVWAGFANLIPYVGPIAGAIPALFSVLMSQPPNLMLSLILVVVVFLTVQFIDNNLTSPLLVGKSVDMHPLIIFLTLMIGANLMGLLGMMFAVPVAGIIKVTFSEIITNAPKYRA